MSKKTEYVVNRRVQRFETRLDDLRTDFKNQEFKSCNFADLKNAPISELRNLQIYIKKIIKLNTQAEILIRSGAITKKDTDENTTETNEGLLDALNCIYPGDKAKKLKKDVGNRGRFRKEIFDKNTHIVLEFCSTPEIVQTLNEFYKSIDLSKYKPNGRDYTKSTLSNTIANYSDSDSDSDSEVDEPVVEVKRNLVKTSDVILFKKKLFDFYGADILESAYEDPGKLGVDEIVVEYHNNCLNKTDNLHYIHLSEYAKAHPISAKKIIRRLYMEGQKYIDEFEKK